MGYIGVHCSGSHVHVFILRGMTDPSGHIRASMVQAIGLDAPAVEHICPFHIVPLVHRADVTARAISLVPSKRLRLFVSP